MTPCLARNAGVTPEGFEGEANWATQGDE